MKKLMVLLLTAIMVLGLCGCSGNGKGQEEEGDKYAYLLDTKDLKKPELDLSKADGVLKSVLDNGTLVIATSPDYPAAEFVDPNNGTVYGSEMMLAKYIADCLGVALKIETMDFSAVLAAVDTSKVDLGVSGFGYKADRAEAFELSVGYIGDDDVTYHTLIVPADKADQYKTLNDFVGKHIVAQASSLQQMYVEDQIIALDPNNTTELELVTSLDQAILTLATGKCDAIALDGTTAENYVAQSDGQFALSGIKFDLTIYGDFEGNVIAAKKGEKTLIDAVNTIINTAMDEGYYRLWTAIAKVQSGTADEAALQIVGDMQIETILTEGQE